MAQRSKGAYPCVEICSKSSVFEKVNKNSSFTNCVASMFNHIAAGHGNSRNICWAFAGGDSIFAVGYTFPMQLSRAFIEQTGCNQYFIRRKTIEITPFFLLSFPSFFFLSQTINEIALVLVVVVVVVVLPIQTCFIDYRTANWNTFSILFEIFRYTNILATTPIITRRT